jgi:hypothetical protein
MIMPQNDHFSKKPAVSRHLFSLKTFGKKGFAFSEKPYTAPP